MEISSTRNWSYNDFERAMKVFAPLIAADWMTDLKITPIEYSGWSDMLYVTVEISLTLDAEIEISEMSLSTKERFKHRICDYMKNYFRTYLNTNIGIKELKGSSNYDLRTAN